MTFNEDLIAFNTSVVVDDRIFTVFFINQLGGIDFDTSVEACGTLLSSESQLARIRNEEEYNAVTTRQEQQQQQEQEAAETNAMQ